MDRAAFVCGAQAGADLSRQFERALDREAPDAPQQRRQFLAVHVLHGKEGVAFHLVDVVNAADVGMRYLSRHPHFVVKLRQAGRVAIEFRLEGTSAPPAGRA